MFIYRHWRHVALPAFALMSVRTRSLNQRCFGLIMSLLQSLCLGLDLASYHFAINQ